MDSEEKNITKGQLVDSFMNFNYHMKQYYPHVFDTRKFGSFIVGIRTMSINEFENNKDGLVKKLESLNTFDPHTNIFDTKELFNS